MLILFPILIGINYLLGPDNSNAMIFVDIAVGLIYFLVVEVMLSKIKKKREGAEKSVNPVDEIVVEAEVVEEKGKDRQNTIKKDKK